MGLELFLANKRIKDRIIKLGVLWTDSYIQRVAEKHDIKDPLTNDKFNRKHRADGTLILSYRAYLKRIQIILRNKGSLYKYEKEALKRVKSSIKNINRAIRNRKLPNWYLVFG